MMNMQLFLCGYLKKINLVKSTMLLITHWRQFIFYSLKTVLVLTVDVTHELNKIKVARILPPRASKHNSFSV